MAIAGMKDTIYHELGRVIGTPRDPAPFADYFGCSAHHIEQAFEELIRERRVVEREGKLYRRD